MMISKPKTLVTLYFDVISPYSWIAFESLSRYEKVLPITLKLKPLFLGGLIRQAENRGPATVPIKAAYMHVDLEHNNRYWGMNLKWPSTFQEIIMTKGTLLPQRFLTALDLRQPEYVSPVANELWHRIWERDEPSSTVANLEEVCKKLKIPKYESILPLVVEKEVKDQLIKNTDEAYQLGAFGIPWIVVQKPDEKPWCIFGSDRLHILCHELGYEFQGPLKNLATSS